LAKQSKELGNKELDEYNDQLDHAIGEAKELQARTPWHREGTDKPPVKRQRSAGAMTKGIPHRLREFLRARVNLDRQASYHAFQTVEVDPTTYDP